LTNARCGLDQLHLAVCTNERDGRGQTVRPLGSPPELRAVLLPCLADINPRRCVVSVRHVKLADIAPLHSPFHHQLHRPNNRLDPYRSTLQAQRGTNGEDGEEDLREHDWEELKERERERERERGKSGGREIDGSRLSEGEEGAQEG
jgi:hypothetical protein